jgi:protocatechuate 3,4-dioxygenase beta subunit
VSCNGQPTETSQAKHPKINKSKRVGGGCDGCDLMYVGMPKKINQVDTSAGWKEEGQKLIVTGTVFHLDGKTPAPNVLVYYWQTDNNGFYSSRARMDEGAKKHGHLRGWIKTDKSGKYTIYTIRPAPYPNNDIPAHIHLSIKEPNIEDEYFVDDLHFDDDKLLRPYRRKYPFQNRGGSGILRVLLKDDLQIAEHDIVLGLNIPNYPKKAANVKQSGLEIGEDQPSFMPFHAFGPDKGTQNCPVCNYGRFHGIVYFVGNRPNWEEIKQWLTFLERESTKRQDYLKVYFVYGNERNYKKAESQHKLEQIGKELNIKNVALTFVPSFSDKTTEANLNKINPNTENTFIIYKHRQIVDKYIDLQPTAENFKIISSTLDKTQGNYFDLAEPKHN